MNEKFEYWKAFYRVRCERIQVNPDNSRAMSALTLILFKFNTLHKERLTNRQILSQPKPMCNDSGVLNLHHHNKVKELVASQPSITWYKSANQKTKFVQ